MPVYEYECEKCKKVFEIQQRMADDPLQECPECHGKVKKLMSVNSFQLKGGGWYADGYSSSNKSSSSETKAPACSTGGGCSGGCAATAK